MSSPRSNSGGLSGCHMLASPREDEMKAFDSLPERAREAMRNCHIDLNAVATLEVYRILKCTEEQIVKLIEASDEALVQQLEHNR